MINFIRIICISCTILLGCQYVNNLNVSKNKTLSKRSSPSSMSIGNILKNKKASFLLGALSMFSQVQGQLNNLYPIKYYEGTDLYDFNLESGDSITKNSNESIIIASTSQNRNNNNSFGTIFKLDSLSNNFFDWEAQIDSSSSNGLNSIVHTFSNTYLGCGYHDVIDLNLFTPQFNTRPFLISIDDNAEPISSSTLSISNINQTSSLDSVQKCNAQAITEDKKSLIVITKTYEGFSSEIHIVKINPANHIENDLKQSISFNTTINKPTPISKYINGDYLIGTSSENNLYFYKFNNDISYNSSYKVKVNNDSILHSLKILKDDSIFAITTSSLGIEYIKISNKFDIDWSKEITIPLSLYQSQIGVASKSQEFNNNLFISGTLPIQDRFYGMINKLDLSNGNLIWSKVINESLATNYPTNTIINNIILFNNSVLGIGTVKDPLGIESNKIITVPLDLNGLAINDCNNIFVNNISLPIITKNRYILNNTPNFISASLSLQQSASVLLTNLVTQDTICCVVPRSAFLSPVRSFELNNSSFATLISYGDKLIVENNDEIAFGTNSIAESPTVDYNDIAAVYLVDQGIDILEKNEYSSSSNIGQDDDSIASITRVNNGFISCGNTFVNNISKIIFTKFDDNLNILDNKFLNDSIDSHSICRSVITTLNDDIAFCGQNSNKSIVGLVDSDDLSVLNNFIINFTNQESLATSLDELSNGTIVSLITEGNSDSFLTYIDFDNSQINSFEISSINLDPIITDSVKVFQNDDIALTFYPPSGSTRGFEVLVLESNAALIDSYTLNISSVTELFPRLSVKETLNNDIFLTGSSLINGNSVGFFTEIDYNIPSVLNSKILNNTFLFNEPLGVLESVESFIVDSLHINDAIILLASQYIFFSGSRRLLLDSTFRNGKVYAIELDENRNVISECDNILEPITITLSDANLMLTSSTANTSSEVFSSNNVAPILLDTTSFQTECGITNSPTNNPSLTPTNRPSIDPTEFPSLSPSITPSDFPSTSPFTPNPSTSPTPRPTIDPTPNPTDEPTFTVVINPSQDDDDCDAGDRFLDAITFGQANDCLSGPEVALSLALPLLCCCCCCCCCLLCCCCCCLLCKKEKKRNKKRNRRAIQRSIDNEKQKERAYEEAVAQEEIAKYNNQASEANASNRA